MHKSTIVTTLLSLCSSGPGRISTIRLSCLRFLLCCLWLFAGLLLAGSLAQAEIKAGDILISDSGGGTKCGGVPWPCGALFVVNPETGQRTVLSDFGNPAQGSLGAGAVNGVAVGAAGRIFVTDLFAGEPLFDGGALFEVDPDTGNRTRLSNFSQGAIHGNLNFGLAVDAKGRVIANLQTFDPPLYELHQAVVRVDPDTAERTVVTDLTNPAQGETDPDRFITDLALERSGKILLGTDVAGLEELDAEILRVHPVTGKRTLLSDFANPTQGADVGDLYFSAGLAVETSGEILVASGNSVVAPRNLLFRIHPKTGQRTVLSDFDDPAQGPLGIGLRGVVLEKTGKIIVGAGDAAIGSSSVTLLFRVDPHTGLRTLLSDSDNPVQGPAFHNVSYIAVVPKDSDAEDDD